MAGDLDLDLSQYPDVELKLATPEEIASSYKEIVGGTSCKDYRQPKGQYIPRGAIELLILCRAFTEAGLSPRFIFIPSPNYSRSVLMVETGVAHLSSETIWQSDLDHRNVWSSVPVIRDYELEKGLYAVPSSAIFKSNLSKLDVRRFTGVSIKNWHTDWEALIQITPHVRNVFHYSAIFNTLEIGRADFTLFEFPNSPDLKIMAGGIELQPVPKVKVSLPGSRHFIVARQFKNSHEIHALINTGIDALRKKGVIEQIYRDSGFYHPLTEDWKVLNADSAEALYGPSANH